MPDLLSDHDVNVVENFGPNSRVSLLFRRIIKLRVIEPEDRVAACAIQETLGASANQHLTFGYFEKAMVHFHLNLSEHLSEKS